MFQTDSEISIILLAGTGFVLFIIIALLVFVYIHHLNMQKINFEQEAKELQQKQEIHMALEKGESRERKRLSEELHDGVGAELTAIKYGLEHIESIMDAEDNRESLRKNIDYLNRVINETRTISQNLQPEFLNQKGLSMALQEWVDQLNSRSGTRFSLYIETRLPVDMNSMLALNIYRIIGELFNNILKHAKAEQASAQLTETENRLLIIVEDDGVGMNKDQMEKVGIGLVNMHNRVTELGGTMDIDSSEKGTTTIITLPVTKQE